MSSRLGASEFLTAGRRQRRHPVWADGDIGRDLRPFHVLAHEDSPFQNVLFWIAG